MAIQTRIIDVYRKPSKCPVCGGDVVDIVYETGDTTEMEYFLWFRKPAIMGGDNIPRRPPIWACSNGCKRFRKINLDGTDAPVKVKKMKNMRQAPATTFNWQSEGVSKAIATGEDFKSHRYLVKVITDWEEEETFLSTALNPEDAAATIKDVIESGKAGLVGQHCEVVGVKEDK